jgi:hypothetical protein
LEGLAPYFRLPGIAGLRNQGDVKRPRWRSIPGKRVAPLTWGKCGIGYKTRSSTSHFLPSCLGDRSGEFPMTWISPRKVLASGFGLPRPFHKGSRGNTRSVDRTSSTDSGCPDSGEQWFRMGVWYPPGRSRVWDTGEPVYQAQGLPGRRELFPRGSDPGIGILSGTSQGPRSMGGEPLFLGADPEERSLTFYSFRNTFKAYLPRPEGSYRLALKDMFGRSFVCPKRGPAEAGSLSGTHTAFPT